MMFKSQNQMPMAANIKSEHTLKLSVDIDDQLNNNVGDAQGDGRDAQQDTARGYGREQPNACGSSK